MCKRGEKKPGKEDEWQTKRITLSSKCTFPLHEPSGTFPTAVTQPAFYSGLAGHRGGRGLPTNQKVGGSIPGSVCQTC